MMDLQPQSIPETVTKRKEAIWLYLIATIGLVAMGVIFVIGIFVLAWAGREIPGGAWVVLGGLVTGLTGMVAVQSQQQQKIE